MFDQQQAQDFLNTLLGQVWQNAELQRIDDFYHQDTIGHQQGEIFGLDHIRERMQKLNDFSIERKFVIQSFVIIDDLIIFRMRQTWVSLPDKKLAESLVMAVYRMRGEKVCEVWLMTDEQTDTYLQVNQNIVETMGGFQCSEKDKREFMVRLADYRHFHRGELVELKPKARECLYYYLHGYSSKETAREINLSYRTVETYMAKTKELYDCFSRSELRGRLFPGG